MGREAKYVIRLTEEERSALQDRIGKPRAAAAKVLRARMVLKAMWTVLAGLTRKLGRPLRLECLRSIDCASAWSKRAWRRRCCVGRVRHNAGRNWTVSRKPAASPSRAVAHRRDVCAGPCSCSPTTWSSWTSWTTSAPRRYGRREKKRAQAVAEAAVGDSSRSACRLRLRDGRCAGSLSPAARPATPCGVLRCIEQATGEGNAPADTRGCRSSRHNRRRVRAERHREPVHDVCTAGRPTPRCGDGTSHRDG